MSTNVTEIPRPLHPTPDKVRKNWMNLNGTWDFSFELPTFDKKITVPFSWESPLSGIGEEYKGTGWYRRNISYDPGENLLFLHLGAVDYECDVFVNTVHLAHHFGGYTPITVNVTDAWDAHEENEIIIRAVDYDYDYQTYGKQGYGNARGIWQTVWLEERPQTYIDHFRITTLCSGEVTIKAEVKGSSDYILTACFGGITASSSCDTVTLQIPEPRLWSPEDPNLYEGTLSVSPKDGSCTDEIQTYFGIREVGTMRVDDRKRKYITLNGKPIYINSCLDQSFHRTGFFTFPEDTDTENEIRQMKEVGLNCARIHIKPEDPRKLYWADRLGLLVMADLPCFWGTPNPVARSLFETQMYEVLERDVNHPSIFYWIVFNETWGLFTPAKDEPDGASKTYLEETQEWVVDCYHKVKAYDPTRLVEDNSACNRDHTVTDVNTWHFYANGYENTKKAITDYVDTSNVGDTFNFIGKYACEDVPLMNSECGNVWGLDGNAGDSDISWHYKYMMNEFRLHDEICGFVFTEFRDVINEFNGYYRIDDTKKDFGYESYVPGMTIKDLHSYDFLAADCPPMATCKGGETVSVPLIISSFTDVNHNTQMTLRWEVVQNTPEEAITETGSRIITYSHYGCTELEPLTITLPQIDGIVILRLYLETADGECLMRNFLVYDVEASCENDGKNISNNTLTMELKDFNCTGFKSTALLQCDNKLNCIGSGKAQITVDKSAIPGYEPGKEISIVFEASAKQELTKDRPAEDKKDKKVDLNYMLGYRVDRGANPNSYYQTDEDLFPTDISLSVEDTLLAEYHLSDAPADSRGCLSWHYQPNPRKNEEAGSYGYLCKAVIPADLAASLPESFILSITGSDFSLYNRKSGRYPIAFQLQAE